MKESREERLIEKRKLRWEIDGWRKGRKEGQLRIIEERATEVE